MFPDHNLTDTLLAIVRAQAGMGKSMETKAELIIPITRFDANHNYYVQGSVGWYAQRQWEESCRPSTIAILDWIDTEWEKRFADEDFAWDFYCGDITDKAERELWQEAKELSIEEAKRKERAMQDDLGTEVKP